MGDLNKSLEYSTKALEIQERLFPGDHPDKATSYNNIGHIYLAMGDLNKSIEYFTKAFIRPYK
jgi:tetratricopeptide (TPR) repeat protein